MQPNLFAVIVLYNKKCEESITFNNILKIKYKKLHIIILDNSTENMNNEEYCKNNKINYISMNGNKGLSIAYNRALNYLKGKNLNDFIILLDDDTEIHQDYFDTLLETISKNYNYDIFAPIIYGQDGIIYSPNEANILKNKLMKSETEEIDPNKYNAINSCLAIKLKVFEKYRYNENLFMDQVDQQFFDDQRKLNVKFMTLNTVINQNFSQRGKKLSSRMVLARFKIRITDMMEYCNKDIKSNILGLIKVCGWGIQMSIKCKSIFLPIIFFVLGLKSFIRNNKQILKKFE